MEGASTSGVPPVSTSAKRGPPRKHAKEVEAQVAYTTQRGELNARNLIRLQGCRCIPPAHVRNSVHKYFTKISIANEVVMLSHTSHVNKPKFPEDFLRFINVKHAPWDASKSRGFRSYRRRTTPTFFVKLAI